MKKSWGSWNYSAWEEGEELIAAFQYIMETYENARHFLQGPVMIEGVMVLTARG